MELVRADADKAGVVSSGQRESGQPERRQRQTQDGVGASHVVIETKLNSYQHGGDGTAKVGRSGPEHITPGPRGRTRGRSKLVEAVLTAARGSDVLSHANRPPPTGRADQFLRSLTQASVHRSAERAVVIPQTCGNRLDLRSNRYILTYRDR